MALIEKTQWTKVENSYVLNIGRMQIPIREFLMIIAIFVMAAFCLNFSAWATAAEISAAENAIWNGCTLSSGGIGNNTLIENCSSTQTDYAKQPYHPLNLSHT